MRDDGRRDVAVSDSYMASIDQRRIVMRWRQPASARLLPAKHAIKADTLCAHRYRGRPRQTDDIKPLRLKRLKDDYHYFHASLGISAALHAIFDAAI